MLCAFSTPCFIRSQFCKIDFQFVSLFISLFCSFSIYSLQTKQHKMSNSCFVFHNYAQGLIYKIQDYLDFLPFYFREFYTFVLCIQVYFQLSDVNCIGFFSLQIYAVLMLLIFFCFPQILISLIFCWLLVYSCVRCFLQFFLLYI